MALIFADSFDHLSNAYLQSKWTSVSSFGNPGQGLKLNNTDQRTGIQCGAFSASGAFVTIKNASTWIAGAAFNWQQYGGGILFQNIGTIQVQMLINNDGTLSVFNGPHGPNPGVLLGRTDPSVAITLGRYYYIEFKSVINQTTGTAVVRINGQVVLNLAGVNTSPNGDNNADSFAINGPGGGVGTIFVFVDDLYVCDDSGSANTDFLGDVKIGLIMPAAAGDYTQWTPVGGSTNYLMVNEVPPDGDATYVDAVAPTPITNPFPIDSYFFQTVDPNTVILAIQANILARKDDVGNRALSLLTRFGGADHLSDPTGRFVNETYIDYRNPQDVNPLTSLQWTPATLNLAQFGYKLIA
jgi:hypothetical protein